MEVYRSEIKVGVLIAVAFVLFLVGIFVVGDVRSLWDKKHTLVLLFPYADGITKGAPVWYAGLEVGAVTDVRIASEKVDRIAISVKISPDAKVRRDSRIDIRSLGMMGQKYVEISPGTPDSPLLVSGDSLEGKGPASLSEIFETGKMVATRLVDLIQETQGLVHDVRTESPIKDAISNANGLMTDLRDQAKDLRAVMQKAAKFTDVLNSVGSDLKHVSGTGGKELTALLAEMRDTNKSLQQRLINLEARLDKTLGHVDSGFIEAEGAVKGVRSMISANEEDVAAMLRHMKETSRYLEALSEDLKAHPWKVVWKEDGSSGPANPAGSEKWRDKGRIGPHGK